MNARSRPKMLFVYNADRGVFNAMADIAHKIFSPESYECALCNLTHGYFRERAGWKAFVEGLTADCEFLHRDEFRRRYPNSEQRLPAVFRVGENGELEPLLDAERLDSIGDASELQRVVREHLKP